MNKIIWTALAAATLLTAQTPPVKPAPAKSAPPKDGAATVRSNARRAPAAGSASVTVPSYTHLKFPPLRQVRVPDIAQFTLPNGMRVFLLENHELPLVSGFALVRTGNLFDPADKVRLSGATNYDPKFDVLRVPMTVGSRADSLEQFTIAFANVTASAARLIMSWERTVATVDVRLAAAK